MIHLKNVGHVSKINVPKNIRISNGNIMVIYHQKIKKFPKLKNFPSKGGGRGSQSLGIVPKLYLVINYDGFH